MRDDDRGDDDQHDHEPGHDRHPAEVAGDVGDAGGDDRDAFDTSAPWDAAEAPGAGPIAEEDRGRQVRHGGQHRDLGPAPEACELLPDTGISNAHTTVSTVGWVPGIERLAAEGPPVRLALSLHAADDALRSELMPVNERYPLSEVLAACRVWHESRRRRVFIEYLMLAGVNDRHEQALALADLLQPRDAFKVNLIPYNPTGTGFEGSSRPAIDHFRDALAGRGVPATVRLTRGRDIDAACGQLAAATS